MEGALSREEYFANLRAAQDYLAHHGVKGQKWGERHYQNEDGSLTAEGYEHYYGGIKDKAFKKYEKIVNRDINAGVKVAKKAARKGNVFTEDLQKRSNLANKEFSEDKELAKNYSDLNNSAKKARAIGLAIGVGLGLGANAIMYNKTGTNIPTEMLAMTALGSVAVGQAIHNRANREKRSQTYAKLDAIERKYDNMSYADVVKEHERVFGNDKY